MKKIGIVQTVIWGIYMTVVIIAVIIGLIWLGMELYQEYPRVIAGTLELAALVASFTIVYMAGSTLLPK
jgi:hypothetical protein